MMLGITQKHVDGWIILELSGEIDTATGPQLRQTIVQRVQEGESNLILDLSGVDFVDFDGPSVIVTLKGRFWHQSTTVLERVEKYIQGRIPEVVEVIVEDPWELTDEANDAAY